MNTTSWVRSPAWLIGHLVGHLDAVDGAVVVVEHPLTQDLVAVGVLKHLLLQEPGAAVNHRVLSRAGVPLTFQRTPSSVRGCLS